MSKKIIKQSNSENTYFHPDFHIALNYGIDYLHNSLGENAVREYLMQFANSYFAPLKEKLMDTGLIALKEHYAEIFEIENATYTMQISPDELLINLAESPAVIHIRKSGHNISPLYHETIITVNTEICKYTPFECEVLDYQKENGAYKLRFYRGKL